MAVHIKTVIIPAAGRGTRLLPLTKVTPKELLPIYDQPAIHFAVAEALETGAERVVIVVHPSKMSIRDFLTGDRRDAEIFQRNGKVNHSANLDAQAMRNDAEIVFVTQKSALGLGHAVLCCKDVILSGPIGIILPDDVILGAVCLGEMAQDYIGGHMVAAMDVEADETSQYGMFIPNGRTNKRSIPAIGMVEKPSQDKTPSNLAAVGRYLLDPVVMHALASTAPGKGNEIQLTDAIAQDAPNIGLTAFRFSGTRFDCGSLEGLSDAGVARREMLKHREKNARIKDHQADARQVNASLALAVGAIGGAAPTGESRQNGPG